MNVAEASVVDGLPVLSLQVAVPKYPWTDLAYSRLPNGHGGGPAGDDLSESTQGQPSTGLSNPLGVAKQSYAHALLAIGNTTGTFEQGTTTTPYRGADQPVGVVYAYRDSRRSVRHFERSR